MDPVLVAEKFAKMNHGSEINGALSVALSAVDDLNAEDSSWSRFEDSNSDSDDSKASVDSNTEKQTKKKKDPNESDDSSRKEITFLHDQILRSATRILFAEKEVKATQKESEENGRILERLHSEMIHTKELSHKIRCERSEDEKQALSEFQAAVARARQEYQDARKLIEKRRRAKLQLVYAAQERLDTLQVSHQELGRIYEKKKTEQEQKLAKETLLYQLNLESLDEAQQQLEKSNEVEQEEHEETVAGAAAAVPEKEEAMKHHAILKTRLPEDDNCSTTTADSNDSIISLCEWYVGKSVCHQVEHH